MADKASSWHGECGSSHSGSFAPAQYHAMRLGADFETAFTSARVLPDHSQPLKGRLPSIKAITPGPMDALMGGSASSRLSRAVPPRGGRSMSFDDVSALAEQAEIDAYHGYTEEDEEEDDRWSALSLEARPFGPDVVRDSHASPPRLPDASFDAFQPLHMRFQQRLVGEVEETLERAATASGDERSAALRDLYRNLTTPIEAAVVARLRASGMVGPVPTRYFGLLARFYASEAQERPAVILRQRGLWLKLVSSDLFPAVWASLFHLWMLGGYHDLNLAAPGTAPPETGAQQEEVEDSPLPAAPGGTPGTRVRDRESAPSVGDSLFSRHRRSLSDSRLDPTDEMRSKQSMDLLVAGVSRLFWSDAHAGTKAFQSIFLLCHDALVSSTKLSHVPPQTRRELASVVACHFLHYLPGSQLRRFLACLPDLETGAMPFDSRNIAVSEAPSAPPPASLLAPHTTPAKQPLSDVVSTHSTQASVEFSKGGPSSRVALPMWMWRPLQAIADRLGISIDALSDNIIGIVHSHLGVAGPLSPLTPEVSPEAYSELALRAGQFVEEVVVHLRSLKRQDSIETYIYGLQGLSGVPMQRAVANRLHAALHVFATPGGPVFPSPQVRAVATETIENLFPRGSSVRHAVHLACRLLHPVRAAYSCCNWTRNRTVSCAQTTWGFCTAPLRFGVLGWGIERVESVAEAAWSSVESTVGVCASPLRWVVTLSTIYE
jgi:hypothetical protein